MAKAPPEERTGSTAAASALIASSLLIGSSATLIPRLFLLTPCDAAGDGDLAMHAPIFAGCCAFAANALGLLIQAAGERRFMCARAKSYAWALLPGVLATLATLLQLLALVFIPAATLAGLRGSFIVFTAIASSFLGLRDAPRSRVEWLCVAVSGAGAALVGVAGWLAGGDADGATASGGGAIATGVLLSVVGYAFASALVCVEQVILDSRGLSRWEVLGVEGSVGVVASVVLLGAVSVAGSPYPSSLDDPLHTLRCMRAVPSAAVLAGAYGAASLTFNALQLALAQSVGPNLRVFVFTSRGLVTWGVELALAYWGSAAVARYGERSAPLPAALELLGWVALISAGTYAAHAASVRAAQSPKAPAAEGALRVTAITAASLNAPLLLDVDDNE